MSDDPVEKFHESVLAAYKAFDTYREKIADLEDRVETLEAELVLERKHVQVLKEENDKLKADELSDGFTHIDQVVTSESMLTEELIRYRELLLQRYEFHPRGVVKELEMAQYFCDEKHITAEKAIRIMGSLITEGAMEDGYDTIKGLRIRS
jgi:hypothetical protein